MGKIKRAIDRESAREAETLLEEYRRMTAKRSKLHRQRLLLAESVLNWKKGDDNAGILSSLQDAWSITMSGIPMRSLSEQRLTLTEFVLAMMYARVLETAGEGGEAAKQYEVLVQYFEDYMDEEDSVKLLPQIAYRLIRFYLEQGNKEQAVLLAEKSVALLKVRGRLFYLRFFLEVLIDYGALASDEERDMRNLCGSLRWLYKEFDVPEEVWLWDVSYGMLGIESCGSLIRARRMALGMTQEQLSEGICDPVSISRIERNEVAPKRQIFELLMERVGMTGSSYEALTQMGDPELMELAVQITILLLHSKGAEAEPLIEQLENSIKQTDRFTQQFIWHVRALALFCQKKISSEEHAEIQEKALHLTLPEMSSENLRKWCFSSREISIVNVISYSYDKMGRRDEKIKLLSLIREQLENKPFALENYIPNYELTMRNLGNLLGNEGRYEEAIEASKIGIRRGLQAGRGSIVTLMLYDCGWDMEKLWKTGKYTREDSLRYMKACYSLELLFARCEDSEFTSRHIEKYYGK